MLSFFTENWTVTYFLFCSSPTKGKIPVSDDEALDSLMLALGIKGGPAVAAEPAPEPEPEPEPEREPIIQTPEVRSKSKSMFDTR